MSFNTYPVTPIMWPELGETRFPYSVYIRGDVKDKRWTCEWEKTKFEADEAAGHPNLYGADDIQYDFNRCGFRCIDFDQIPEESYRVLSVGCSNTEGYGLPVEHTWPHLICEYIRTRQSRPVINLNLGTGAACNRTIALRTVHGINLLKPDIVFIGWSWLLRFLYVDELFWPMDWAVPNPHELANRTENTATFRKVNYFEHLHNTSNDLSSFMVDLMLVNQAQQISGLPVCHLFDRLNPIQREFVQLRHSGGIHQNWNTPGTARDLVHPGLDYNQWLVGWMINWYESQNLSN